MTAGRRGVRDTWRQVGVFGEHPSCSTNSGRGETHTRTLVWSGVEGRSRMRSVQKVKIDVVGDET